MSPYRLQLFNIINTKYIFKLHLHNINLYLVYIFGILELQLKNANSELKARAERFTTGSVGYTQPDLTLHLLKGYR